MSHVATVTAGDTITVKHAALIGTRNVRVTFVGAWPQTDGRTVPFVHAVVDGGDCYFTNADHGTSWALTSTLPVDPWTGRPVF